MRYGADACACESLLLSLNVRSLPSRLELLLSLPFHLLALTEVRASGSGIKSLSRVAARLGFDSIWSSPPPPSPTFTVSPGGCAFFARSPLSVSTFVMPALQKWVNEARLCVAMITDSAGSKMCIATCYGYPASHPKHSANEDLLRDVLTSLGDLTCPAVLVGDLNTHPNASNVLARALDVGMHRISPDHPTTLTKDGKVASRPALDHAYVNRRGWDLGIKAKVDATLRLSDHLPVLLRFVFRSPRFSQVVWPTTIKSLQPKQCEVPCIPIPMNFDQWQACAMGWLTIAHQQPIPPKGLVGMKLQEYSDKQPAPHLRFRRLLSLQRAAFELSSFGWKPTLASSIRRKLHVLKRSSWCVLLDHPQRLYMSLIERLCATHRRVTNPSSDDGRQRQRHGHSRMRQLFAFCAILFLP